jgi:hypothetical protein
MRTILMQGGLACIAVLLVTVAAHTRGQTTDPSASTSMYLGSIDCVTNIYADGDWRLNVSENFITPNGSVHNSDLRRQH